MVKGIAKAYILSEIRKAIEVRNETREKVIKDMKVGMESVEDLNLWNMQGKVAICLQNLYLESE